MSEKHRESPTRSVEPGSLRDDYDGLVARRKKAMGRTKPGCFSVVLAFLVPTMLVAAAVVKVVV